jgi:hypothetical protein
MPPTCFNKYVWRSFSGLCDLDDLQFSPLVGLSDVHNADIVMCLGQALNVVVDLLVAVVVLPVIDCLLQRRIHGLARVGGIDGTGENYVYL